LRHQPKCGIVSVSVISLDDQYDLYRFVSKVAEIDIDTGDLAVVFLSPFSKTLGFLIILYVAYLKGDVAFIVIRQAADIC